MHHENQMVYPSQILFYVYEYICLICKGDSCKGEKVNANILDLMFIECYSDFSLLNLLINQF